VVKKGGLLYSKRNVNVIKPPDRGQKAKNRVEKSTSGKKTEKALLGKSKNRPREMGTEEILQNQTSNRVRGRKGASGKRTRVQIVSPLE